MSCAHFYRQNLWDEKKNREEFGLCFTEFGHGHDYTVEIEIETEDLEAARHDFASLVQSLDHQHLNFTVPEFRTQIPTTENLTLYLKNHLQESFQKHKTKIQAIKLNETIDLWTES